MIGSTASFRVSINHTSFSQGRLAARGFDPSQLVAWAATWALLAQALFHQHSPLLLLGITVVQAAGFALT